MSNIRPTQGDNHQRAAIERVSAGKIQTQPSASASAGKGTARPNDRSEEFGQRIVRELGHNR